MGRGRRSSSFASPLAENGGAHRLQRQIPEAAGGGRAAAVGSICGAAAYLLQGWHHDLSLHGGDAGFRRRAGREGEERVRVRE